MDKTKQKQQINQLAEKYHLKMILLFGSRVKNKINKESDIDIAVLPEKKLTFNSEIMINYELTQILRSEKIDLVNLQKAPPLLMKEIIENNEMLYEISPGIYDRFELYVLQRNAEAKPLYQIHKQVLEHFLSNSYA